MNNNRIYFNISSILLILSLLLGCSSSVEHSLKEVVLIFKSSEDINPNVNGRASPVDVHIFQLKNINTFNQSTFNNLYTKAPEIFGKDFISEHKFEININQSNDFILTLDQNTRYLGFLVAYYDLKKAKWREIITLSDIRNERLTINLNALDFDIN